MAFIPQHAINPGDWPMLEHVIGLIDYEAEQVASDLSDHAASDGSSHTFIDQDVTIASSPVFANVSLGTGELTAGSVNRAAGTLTLEIGGTAEISITSSAVTLGGNLIIPDGGTIGSATSNNAVTIAANGELTLSDVIVGVLPIIGDHLATKEYVDLAIGSELDFFLSDTDDGVIADTHVMYELETGEAQSTEVTPSLSAGSDQLLFTWLSEVGRPAASHAREGVYDMHVHLHKSGTKDVAVYWTLSYVDADGSSNETLITTSEISPELTVSEIAYDIHAVVSTDTTTGATKRLFLRLYGNIGASGSNPTVTVTMEGTTDSHLTIDVPSDVWQLRGDVLDDLNLLGAAASDGQFIVATGAGAFAYESTTVARTSLGVGEADTPTLSGLVIANGGTVGQAAGPLLTFNDTDNILKLEGTDYFHISDSNAVAAALITSDVIVISAFDTAAGVGIAVAGPDSTDRAFFKGTRSDGTLASPTVPSDGDLVLSFLGAIYDGATSEGTAAIDFFVDGTVTENNAPQGINFVTSETTAVARTVKVTIKADGKMGVGTEDPDDVVDIVGRLRIQDTKADATNKTVRIRLGHYTNSEEPVTCFIMSSVLTTSTLNIGGGSGIENAVTRVDFYIASDNTTVTGTRSVSIVQNRLGVGNPSPLATVHADQLSSSGAIPCLYLDQADVDEVFVNFVGTSAADATRSLSSSVAETAAPNGYIRIKVNGATKWIRFYQGVT